MSKEQTLKKYSKGSFRMNQENGVEVSGEFSPFLRACIGVAIVLLALSPLVLAFGKVLHWLR